MTSPGMPRGDSRTIWEIDPKHTYVELAVKYMMFTTVKGAFRGVHGTIVADEADPTRSSVEVEIEAASLDTGEGQRDEHLRSADFLDVANYPTITFKSARVEKVDEDHERVFGDLTIRGTTRQVELATAFNGRGKDPWGNERAGFTAETTINRRDFGLEWNVALEEGFLVGDMVNVLLEVQAVKQA